MPRPCRPVSPVPEGPAEEDQLQTGMRLRLEEEATKVGLFLAKSGRRWGRGGSFFFLVHEGHVGVWECGGEREFHGRKMRFQIKVFECCCLLPDISVPTCVCFHFSLFLCSSSLFQSSSHRFVFYDFERKRVSQDSASQLAVGASPL